MEEHAQDFSDSDKIRVLVNREVEKEKMGLRLVTDEEPASNDMDFEGEEDSSRFTSQDLNDAMNSAHDGDAKLFVELGRDRFCYDHAAGTWFTWNQHHWVEDRIDETLRGLDGVIAEYESEIQRLTWRRMLAAKERDRDKERRLASEVDRYSKKIRLLHTVQWKKPVLTLAAAGESSLGITGDEWDTDPWLLGCKNGVIDLKTGNLRPGEQSDYIKTVCPAEWKGLDEPAPTWEKFLGDTFNDDLELIAFLQRLLGYAITGLTTEHIFPIISRSAHF